ncbi:cytochrome D1 domain-containing protein [Bryobacter aggregatus]|uniref:cytochrome D1 domain-containing protein n=1 Tax=Bryobacter aggregatus TaxID=360054 RepID=UPI0004E118FC|nr:cytochrome D1 domain-containing protein [Bryobacter aggregatus]
MKALRHTALALSLLSSAAFSAPPEGGVLLVANKGDQTLGIIDPAAGKQVATVAENGITGHEVIASPDGKFAYVPIYGNSGVGKPGTDGKNMIVVDIATRKIVGNLDFGKGLRPHCPIIGPKDGLLYVTTENENTISVIDPKTLKIVGTIPTGQKESHMLALSNNGKRGYTANVGPGTVSVLDTISRKLITTIPISTNTQRISISVDDKYVFTADQTTPRLAVIDTATNKVTKWITLPESGYGTAPTPDGKFLVVAVPKANQVAIVDLAQMKVTKTIDLPSIPQMAVVRPDGKYAYVSCDVSGKVAAIRTSDWKVEKLIDAGKSADGLAWAGR